jgi:hypothetical protein
MTQQVIEYPDEGFAIIKDNQGSYLAFRDSDHIETLVSDEPLQWPKKWGVKPKVQIEEFALAD